MVKIQLKKNLVIFKSVEVFRTAVLIGNTEASKQI